MVLYRPFGKADAFSVSNGPTSRGDPPARRILEGAADPSLSEILCGARSFSFPQNMQRCLTRGDRRRVSQDLIIADLELVDRGIRPLLFCPPTSAVLHRPNPSALLKILPPVWRIGTLPCHDHTKSADPARSSRHPSRRKKKKRKRKRKPKPESPPPRVRANETARHGGNRPD